ncbi:hypothetical protein Tco_0390773, partial [Tanacetum coccineum]
MLTQGHETMLQIKEVTGMELKFNQGWLSVTTVKRKAILLDNAQKQKGPRIRHGLKKRSKVVLMANLSSYDSNVLSDVPFHDTNIENAMSYQSVQEKQCFEKQFVDVDNDTEIDITAVIEEMSSQVRKCNKVQQENIIVHETLTAELERYKEQVILFKQRQKFELNDREKYIDGQLRQ